MAPSGLNPGFINLTFPRLLPQVTNQMITACKAYITTSGSVTLWDQPPQQVIERIAASIRLNQVPCAHGDLGTAPHAHVYAGAAFFNAFVH